MPIRVIPIQDGYALVQPTATGGQFFHIPEDEVEDLLVDLIYAVTRPQFESEVLDLQGFGEDLE